MQNYTEKNIEGVECLVNSTLAEAMEANRMTAYYIGCYVEDLAKGNIDPNDINFETAEFKTETNFIKVFGQPMNFVIEGSVIFEGKNEDGNPESWKLDESAGLQIRRIR